LVTADAENSNFSVCLLQLGEEFVGIASNSLVIVMF